VYFGHGWDQPMVTRISIERIKQLSDRLHTFPDGLELHSRVNKIMADRQKMAAGSLPIDWGFAEIMAYASLVTERVPVRISGQDSGRGTFFHRHAVLHNQRDGTGYVPLRNLAEDQANFLVIDSVLSEEAVLAFEYGYSTNDPHSLVIWEAQFGDFGNGAQVVIDQFISSGEQKWGRLSGLVLLLPHGYEGQGPEHSSARMERFLQLSAQHNMQVCTPTTPAQAFHMLRRQSLRRWRTPLIVMSPKSLLRHKQAVSSLEDLSDGCFMPVITDYEVTNPKTVKTLILCCGKVYYDLLDKKHSRGDNETAIVRIEQLYPFPEVLLQVELDKYVNVEDVVWCQEEPMNQGAWYASQHHIRGLLREDLYLRYVGRVASASPAAGYAHLHVQQQKELVEKAFG
jgi:2-oxoglutarate dehydrogenase E1 component